VISAGDDASKWISHGERLVYDTDWVKLQLADVSPPSGDRHDHHIVTLKPAVLIILLDASRQRILMTRRHRFVHDTWSWEIPGGLIEPDEAAIDAAVRELREETGYRAGRVYPVLTYEPMVGSIRSAHHLFVAYDAEFAGQPTERDEGRFEWVSLAEAGAMVAAGDIFAVGTVAAVLYLLAFGRPDHAGPQAKADG